MMISSMMRSNLSLNRTLPSTLIINSIRPTNRIITLSSKPIFSYLLSTSTSTVTTPLPKRPRFYSRHPIIFSIIAFPFLLGGSLGVIVAGLLAFDATTYSTDKHIERVPMDPLALHPIRGGKKNLKIAEVLVDDSDEKSIATKKKQRLVIVGGGWGAVGILKHLDRDEYHVTVVSPDNYFLFHPLLPSATVGTVELRSLVEPLRKILARVSGHFLQAKAVDLDMGARLVEIESSVGEENFYLPYDKLVIACGSINSTHGVPGLENCFQLKTVPDAQQIRRRISDNLEKAALPSTEEEERRRLLSFVICGGGPTGVEFASELFDMINEDVTAYMPKVLREDISVHIIQSRDHILNTYSQKISDYAEKRFARNEIDTILNARVKAVTPTSVIYTTKNAEGKTIDHTLDSNFVLWSTGIAMNPFTEKVASLLPNQYHRHALEVDSHLRVIGSPLGTVYALGDASTIETRLVDHLLEFVDKCDENKDGVVDEREFERMIAMVKRKFPTAQVHVEKIRDVFAKYANADNVLGMNEVAKMFIEISQRMTALPATAQVANSQGVYLGKKLSVLATKGHEVAALNGVYDDPDDMLHSPFNYKHMGSLAYIGNSAVFDLGGYSFAGGIIAMYLWRSVYWSEQVSLRTRVLLMKDWVIRGIWGRDLSKF